jgi:4'-phosphopantetheinyl transferase EntD
MLLVEKVFLRISQLIDSIFDEGVKISVLSEQSYDEKLLFPQELSILSKNAVLKRRIEFCIGRIAAHDALGKLGIFEFPVLRGEKSDPIWPEGVVGSITHASNIAIAIVAKNKYIDGIGIDIEKVRDRLSENAYPIIGCEKELDWIYSNNEEKLHRLISLFSAKEAFFKCIFPKVRKYFDFRDVILTWDNRESLFKGVLLRGLDERFTIGYQFEVNVLSIEDYVVAFIRLPRS